MAANKKINLTYLWADQSVMLYDFSRKISEGMTDWANSFYGRYGFELDVEPKPLLRKTVAQAAKYQLQKNDGIRPDLRDPSEVLVDDDTRIAELQKQLDAKMNEITNDMQQTDTLLAQLSTIPGTDPRWNSVMAAANRSLAATKQAQREWNRLFQDLNAAGTQRVNKADRLTGEKDLRWQMSVLFKSQKIGSEKRLNIVFCKMGARLAMRSTARIVGNTFLQAWRPSVYIPLSTLLWPYTFIIVDVVDGERRTPAHEIVHAAGHLHPAAITVFGKLEKNVVKLAKGSLGGIPLTDINVEIETNKIKLVPGGLFDGSQNDIMNYALNDPEPEECILADEDKKRLENAFFVTS